MPAASSRSSVCPPLAVLNPGGRDPLVDYSGGAGPFQPGVHPPVNFHAFAACSSGAFCQSTGDVLERLPGRFPACLLLLRRRIGPCLQAAAQLHRSGVRVLLSWKECGFTQIGEQLAHPELWGPYKELLALAAGIISPTGAAIPLPPGLEPPPVHFIPTPYPVDLPEWDFSIPVAERSGIFLGTREFFQPSRNHLAALTLALQVAQSTGTHVTVVNPDKRKGLRLLQAVSAGLPSGCLRVLEGRMPYDAYLRTIARHRVVFQLDRSAVPGQVAGDALLCRSVCLGGDSAVEQLAFGEETRGSFPELPWPERLAALLTDDGLLNQVIAESQARASERLSFAAGRQALAHALLTSQPSET